MARCRKHGENIHVMMCFFFGVVHVNDEVFEHSGSTKELCRFFLLPLVFSYTSSLTSTSFVVPKTAPWVFLSPKPVA